MANLFEQTQSTFGIKNSVLATATGFSPAYISEIRNGKSTPSYEALIRWLDGAEACATGSKRYFCRQMAGCPIDLAIENMSYEDVANLLSLLSSVMHKKMQAKVLTSA